MPARFARRVSGLAAVVLTAGVLLGPACRNEPPPNPPAEPDGPTPELPGAFEDVTADSGVHFEYRNGEEAGQYTILESLGGGVGLIDYDRDGLLDLFLIGGGSIGGPAAPRIQGHSNRLYRNLGGWKFQDVTAETGLDRPVWYGHGCAVADYDCDGWPDLLVTGFGRLALYRNDGGKRFIDVTGAARLTPKRPTHWSTSAGWGDLDGDRYPDLFVAHYLRWDLSIHRTCRGYGPGEPIDICPPNRFDAIPPELFFNSKAGTFRELTGANLVPGKGLGVLIADFDGDGRLDIYLANDAIANHLYFNRGGGKFEERGWESGAALSETGTHDGSMGVDAADLTGNGRLSLFVTNYQQQVHALYQERGLGAFRHASTIAGFRALGTNFVGWGTGFIDYDLDGDEDLVMAHGHVIRHPPAPQVLAQRAVLMENVTAVQADSRNVHFRDHSLAAGPYFQTPHRGRGLAIGDLDNDGRLDLVVSHLGEPVRLLRNKSSPDRHWIGIELVGRDHRDFTGTRIELTASGLRQVRVVKGGGSYASASDRRIVFGLPDRQNTHRLTVTWPTGATRELGPADLKLDRYVQVAE